MIQDKNNFLSTAFGLTLATPPDVIEAEKYLGLNLPEHNGTTHWDLPMPSRYAIDSAGRVVYASVNIDHRTRSDPEECLSVLRTF